LLAFREEFQQRFKSLVVAGHEPYEQSSVDAQHLAVSQAFGLGEPSRLLAAEADYSHLDNQIYSATQAEAHHDDFHDTTTSEYQASPLNGFCVGDTQFPTVEIEETVDRDPAWQAQHSQYVAAQYPTSQQFGEDISTVPQTYHATTYQPTSLRQALPPNPAISSILPERCLQEPISSTQQTSSLPEIASVKAKSPAVTTMALSTTKKPRAREMLPPPATKENERKIPASSHKSSRSRHASKPRTKDRRISRPTHGDAGSAAQLQRIPTLQAKSQIASVRAVNPFVSVPTTTNKERPLLTASSQHIPAPPNHPVQSSARQSYSTVALDETSNQVNNDLQHSLNLTPTFAGVNELSWLSNP